MHINPYEPPKEVTESECERQSQPQDTVGAAILHFAIGMVIVIALAILLWPVVRM